MEGIGISPLPRSPIRTFRRLTLRTVTKDELLTMRVVRIHWDRPHMEAVKAAYQFKFGRTLRSRIADKTSGYYQEMLLALIG